MATNETLIPIPGRLHTLADGGHVAGADEIYDDTLSKTQATINSEVAYLDVDEGTAVVPEFDPESDTVWNKAQVLSDTQKAQVKTNLGLSTVATTGSYTDLSNKPTIPVVPTNVSAFTNDAGYLTQHQDISGKADKSATVSTVTYDTTGKKLTKTINGVTTDVVTAGKLLEDAEGATEAVAGKLATVLAMSTLSATSTITKTTSPEWKTVLLDSEDKVLMGVQQDGTWRLYAGLDETMDCIVNGYV